MTFPHHLPPQAGHAGHYLQTDGTRVGWAAGGGGGGGVYAVSANDSGFWVAPAHIATDFASATGTDIPNLSVTLTTTGRPVRLSLVSAYPFGLDAGSGQALLKGDYTQPGMRFTLWVGWKEGSTIIDVAPFAGRQIGTEEDLDHALAPAYFHTFWPASAGEHTITAHAYLELEVASARASATIWSCALLASEI